MTRIAVSDLSSSHEEKFLDTITAGETKHLYAGLQGPFVPNVIPVDNPTPRAATANSLNNQDWSIDQWMDRLEVQLAELRTQLGNRWR